MKASRTQLAQLLAKRTPTKRLAPAEAKAMAAYLLEEGRTGELSSILRDVRAARANHGQVEVIAASARPLSPVIRRHIDTEARRLYPQAKHVMITAQLDPTLVGGVQLTIADYRLDLSVAGKLKKFKLYATQGKD